MQKTMEILQIVEPGKAKLQTVEIPKPADGEALIEVEAITTCPHWDLHILDGDPMFPGFEQNYPYVLGQPGHEMSGRIVDASDAVKNFKAGQRVVAWRDSGPKRTGCYAQYACIPAENVLPIPEALDAEAITSLELAMCVHVSIDQLRQLDSINDKRVAIAGMGPSGLIALQMARAYGAREIIAIDPVEERRALAMQLGADACAAPGATDLPQSRNDANAFDSALDTTGLKISIESMMQRTRKTVAIFGVLRERIELGPEHWYGGFSLLAYGEHNQAAAESALNLVLENKLDLRPLVSKVLPLREYEDGVALLRQHQAIKVMFKPWS